MIHNGLVSYCRACTAYQSHLYSPNQEINDDTDPLEQLADAGSQHPFICIDDRSLLESRKQVYTVPLANGLEALLLKQEGYTVKEIADIWQTSPNKISLWMNRTKAKLQHDPEIKHIA